MVELSSFTFVENSIICFIWSYFVSQVAICTSWHSGQTSTFSSEIEYSPFASFINRAVVVANDIEAILKKFNQISLNFLTYRFFLFVIIDLRFH